MAVRPPSPPGNVKINDVPKKDDLSTHSMHTAKISGEIRSNADDPGQVRLVVYLSKTRDFARAQKKVTPWGGNRTASVTWTDLDPDTKFYVHVHCEQRNTGKLSNYSSANFWTERRPSTPTLKTPSENVTVNQGDDVTVTWAYQDADRPQDAEDNWQVRWRVPATATSAAGPWVVDGPNSTPSAAETYTIQSTALKASTFYEWTVRTQDVHSTMWSDWAVPRSFYVIGGTKPPLLLHPANDEALSVDRDATFTWKFRDPQRSNYQVRADLRYRAVGANDWTTLFGAVSGVGDDGSSVPGQDQFWIVAANTLQPDFNYEWQVRTYDNTTPTFPSDWSDSETFWSTLTPGSALTGDTTIPSSVPQGALGEGTYKVLAYDRGGKRIRGEITPLFNLTWGRTRDDISTCTFTTNGFTADCCALLSDLRCWAHEIVVFRNGERVWEGPITRIAYSADSVSIEARDVMVYVYRRIMRQGYNDRYIATRDPRTGKVTGGTGPKSVVERAALIIQNALAPSDPNVLPYLTRFDFDDDAQEARAVADWQKTAWEEVDDLAATGGLDYTTVGRRIMLWDTSRPVGRIAELRDKDFFTSPIITEYGMSACTAFGVTSNSGVHGVYRFPGEATGVLGPIELLASAYGEADSGTPVGAMTPSQRSDKQAKLNKQAARNANGRWPSPLVVRIPDNSRLHPSAEVGINQLVPGVFIPLRAKTVCREFAQVQKLDSMTVTVDAAGGELVQVVMSPAPGAGIDPDTESGDE